MTALLITIGIWALCLVAMVGMLIAAVLRRGR